MWYKIKAPKGYETFNSYFINEIHYYRMGYLLLASEQPNAAEDSFAQARNYERLANWEQNQLGF